MFFIDFQGSRRVRERRKSKKIEKVGSERLQERKMRPKRAQEGPAGAQKEGRVALANGLVLQKLTPGPAQRIKDPYNLKSKI